MIPLIGAIGIMLAIAAVSDREDGEDSALVDFLIFVACLGGILYRKHKREQDEE